MVSQELTAAMERLAEKRRTAGMSDNAFDVAAARRAELAAEGEDPAGTRVVDADADGVAAKWAVAPGASSAVRLIYFHGGGYVTGGWNTHRTICTWLSHTAAAAVLFVDYRRAPEHRFPAAVDDAWRAYRWAIANGPDGREGADRLFVAGDSAGAALAVAVMLRCRDEGQPMPAAAALVSGMLDLDPATSAFLQNYGRARDLASLYLPAGGDVRHPWASPAHADLAGLPATIVQTGGADYVKGDSILFAERAQACGLDVELEVWPDMPHVWPRYAPGVPESLAALERLGAYLIARR